MKKASKTTKNKKPKLVKPNWYGFNHEAVAKHFEGNPIFVNDFCVNNEYKPVAVYRSENPNTAKGHKRYMLLQTDGAEGVLVRGMTEEEMEPQRFQDAVLCESCKEILYSVNRHHFTYCKCGRVNIDGGKDYTKVGFETGSKYTMGRLDLLTDKFES